MAYPQHFSIVVLDVEASGGLSAPEKGQVREQLYAIVQDALVRSGIGEGARTIEDRGDGMYLLISADVSKRALIDPFLTTVDAALAGRKVGDIALRLRVVVHQGEVLLDAHGSSGPDVDTAFAMVDSDEVRSALRLARRGRMAVVVQDDLYGSVVRGYPAPDPYAFRMRLLTTKRGRIRAWVTVTGCEVQPGSEPSPDDPPPPRKPNGSPDPAMTVTNWEIGTNQGFAGTNSGNVTFGAQPGTADGN